MNFFKGLKICVRGFHVTKTCYTITQTSKVKLTKDVYNVKRGNYGILTDCHIQQFERILEKSRVLTDPDELEKYNVDWIRIVRGYSSVVLKPKTTEEVSAILKICNSNNLAVCPQGGNTGLVGGSVPVFDEVIINTSLMNKIIKINDIPGSVVCQAGCVLETLDNALADHELMMPLDLGAKGSCQIGGNIATNAGGLRLLRYGSLQANTLGLVVVKADGEVLDCMNTLKKDNTGYHLHNLFIGSEGTLGIITEAAIQCPPKPQSISLAFLGVVDFKQALETYRLARKLLSEILSSVELIDEKCMKLVTEVTGVRNPLSDHPFYILIEVSGSNSTHDEEKLNTFLENAMGEGVVTDGTVTNEPSRMHTIWQLRERITEALLQVGYVYKYDVSLPHDHFYEIVPVLKEKLKDTEAEVVSGYGHLGDGNLHLNICSAQFSSSLLAHIEPFVFEWVGAHNGSISAEHGIGFKKTAFLKYSKRPAAVDTMWQIKRLLDPRGILNPYKVLPPERMFYKVNLIKTKLRNKLQTEIIDGLILTSQIVGAGGGSSQFNIISDMLSLIMTKANLYKKNEKPTLSANKPEWSTHKGAVIDSDTDDEEILFSDID